jgi:hypothetical protein
MNLYGSSLRTRSSWSPSSPPPPLPPPSLSPSLPLAAPLSVKMAPNFTLWEINWNFSRFWHASQDTLQYIVYYTLLIYVIECLSNILFTTG